MSDYLWDKSGPPDPEVQRLENLLSEFAYKPRPPVRRMPWRLLTVAAALVAAVGLSLYMWRLRPGGWEVASLEGAPRIGSNPVSGKTRLRTGQWLVTDGASRARIGIGAIGDVEVAPNSRVSRVRAGETEQTMVLERGKIHAAIYAPPRIFIVETPSATAVDLGCVYTLEVDDAGSGFLRVIAGWVSLEGGGRESFIPATAVCRARKGEGPGTPYFEDAPAPLQTALERLDFGGGGYEALREILAIARPRDALTLWHLIEKTHGPDREAVYNRMAALAPPPEGVTRAGVLALDRAMLEVWWNSLGLGDASWWKNWKAKSIR